MSDLIIRIRHKNPNGRKSPYYYVTSWNENSVIGTYNVLEAGKITYAKDLDKFKHFFPNWLEWDLIPFKDILLKDLGMTIEEMELAIKLVTE